MGHNESTVVEHVVAHQPVDERLDPFTELRWFRLELGERLTEAMGDLHVASSERLEEFDLVVAGHADGRTGLDHAHRGRQHRRRGRTSIHQVAQEHRRATLGMGEHARRRIGAIPEQAEQFDQLVVASVDIADQIEGAMFVGAIGPCRLSRDVGGVDRLDTLQDEDPTEPLPLEPVDRLAELRALPADHVRPEGPIGTAGVALLAEPLGDVQHDRDRQHVMASRQFHQGLASMSLDVRGIDHGDPAEAEANPGDVMQHVERLRRHRLVVVVVRHQGPTEVGAEDLGGREMPGGERRLARAAEAYEHDQGERGQADLVAVAFGSGLRVPRMGHAGPLLIGRTPPVASADRPGDRPRPPAGNGPWYWFRSATPSARCPELGARPLEPGGLGDGVEIRGQRLEPDVVFDVGSRDDHRGRGSLGEHRPFERLEAFGFEMFDDLHQDGGICNPLNRRSQ